MALTAIERKLLETVRTAISRSQQKYVCVAIEWANVEGSKAEITKAKKRLILYIDGLLDGHMTLGSWMRANRKSDWADHLQRAARVDWITWMLGEEVQLD